MRTKLPLMGNGTLTVHRVDGDRALSLGHVVQHQAVNAFCGNGTCSTETDMTSCFGLELCESNASYRDGKLNHRINFTQLSSQRVAFVALATPSATSSADRGGDARSIDQATFAGCVTANTPLPELLFTFNSNTHDTTACSLQPNSIVISNVCVAAAYRQRGVATLLMTAIIDHFTRNEPDDDERRFFVVIKKSTTYAPELFAKRAASLVVIYNKLHFYTCNSTAYGDLLVYDPNRRQGGEGAA